jgi:hypothetical protein
MKRLILFLSTTWAILALNPRPGLTADVPIRVPDTQRAAQSTELIARARYALINYMGACSQGNPARAAREMTEDAVVEIALGEPGVYLGVDEATLRDHCGAGSPELPRSEAISSAWIFPTSAANEVFVQFTAKTASSDPVGGVEYLAIVQMRRDRIVKIRYLAAPESLTTMVAFAKKSLDKRFE